MLGRMSSRPRLAILGPAGRWAALLVVAGCGWDGPPGLVCDRLGLLCDAQDSVQGLALGRTKGATADLDGDGVRDLVSAGEPGLSIAWGQSDVREYRLFAGGVPDAEVGDVDGDGDVDVVFVTAGPAALRVLENRGGREFLEREALTVADGARSVWVGDLDGDDRIDAVVASGGEAGTLTVVTAGLTRAEPMAVGRDLVAVEAGDVDGDGRLDLVAADHGDSAVHVALAQGAGFAAPVRTRTGYGPEYLQLYEFDGDGALDVLTYGGREVWFHAGDGAGGLAEAKGLVVQDGASAGFGAHRDEQGRRWLITVDGAHPVASRLDDADRVVRRVVGGGILVSFGLDMDDGQVLTHGSWFGERHSLASSQVFTELWHGGEGSLQPLALGDLDQDGLLDLVTLERDLKIRRGLPDGTWSEPWTLEVTGYVTAVAVVDATGDGLPDLVLADDAPSVWVAIGAGDGTFTAGPPTPLEDTAYLLHGLAVSGGPAAVAVGGYAIAGVPVFEFDVTGAVIEQTRVLAEGAAYWLDAADLDTDGAEDLVVLTSAPGEASNLVIVPHSADDWGPARTRVLEDVYGDGHPSLAVGDIDRDGRVDAAIAVSGAIVRLMDIAAEAPTAAQVDDFGGYPSPPETALADIDGQGPLDLVICSSGELRVVLVTPGGELQPQAPHDQFISNCALHVDPETQAATAMLVSSRGYSVLRPDVAPSLERTSGFPGGPHALRRVETGDIDADGRDDVVVSDERDQNPSASVTVLWGTADETPRRATWLSGDVFLQAEIAVAPLDERPGDEIVAAWALSSTEIWTYEDGALTRSSRGRSRIGGTVLRVGVQTRDDGPSDVILLGETGPGMVGLIALPRGKDGEFLDDSDVPLWTGGQGRTAARMAIADFDDDGYDDIATLAGPDPGVIVVWGDRGRAGAVSSVPTSMYDRHDVAVGDLDGDGAPELIVAGSEGVALVTFQGREPRTPELPPDFPPRDGLLVADLEGDGRADLLAQHDDVLDIILRSPGDQATLKLGLTPPWSQMRAADIDGDGILDLVGLRDGGVVTRRSGQHDAPEAPP